MYTPVPVPALPDTSLPRMPSSPPGTRLVPIDLSSEAEQAILLTQRKICGWGTAKVPKWVKSQASGLNTLFWITIPPSLAPTALQQTLPLIQRRGASDDVEVLLPTGHVSLDRVDTPEEDGRAPDPSLAAPDGSVLHISALFVRPEFQGLRLGAFAMDQAEQLATREPFGSRNCRAVTVNTMAGRHLPGGLEGPDGVGLWERIGEKMPEKDNAVWYRRRGYVVYKEAPRWSAVALDGETVEFWEVAMRKELGGGEGKAGA